MDPATEDEAREATAQLRAAFETAHAVVDRLPDAQRAQAKRSLDASHAHAGQAALFTAAAFGKAQPLDGGGVTHDPPPNNP